MAREEAEHPAPGVLTGLVVVAEAGEPRDRRERAEWQPVGERMPGVRVLLDVVRNVPFGQFALQFGDTLACLAQVLIRAIGIGGVVLGLFLVQPAPFAAAGEAGDDEQQRGEAEQRDNDDVRRIA